MGSCTRRTVYNYTQRHLELHVAVKEIVEGNLDLAERVVLNAIKQDNMTATNFYLKTKGRHRGYVERAELTGAAARRGANKTLNHLTAGI
jgi:hypothetical protein